MIAVVVMAVALLSVMMMNSYSSKGTMDAYYQLLAMQLAQEPIEIFRAFGYNVLKTGSVIPGYPLNTWADVTELQNLYQPDTGSPLPDGRYPWVVRGAARPVDSTMFQRYITLTAVNMGTQNGIRITVRVKKKGSTRVGTWLSRDLVTLESLLMEVPE